MTVEDTTNNITFMYGSEVSDAITTAAAEEGNISVTISLDRYQDLLETEAWSEALDAAGVDNWEGVDLAQEIYDAFNVV